MNIKKVAILIVPLAVAFILLGFVTNTLISTYDYIFNLSLLLETLLYIGIISAVIGVIVPLLCILVNDSTEKLVLLCILIGSLLIGIFIKGDTRNYIPFVIVTFFTGLGLFLTDLSIKHLYTNLLKPNLGVSVRASIREFFSLFALSIGLGFFVYNNSPAKIDEIKGYIVGNVIFPISYQIINEADKQITGQVDYSESILENSLKQFLQNRKNSYSEEDINNLLNEINIKGTQPKKVLGTFDTNTEINNAITKQAVKIIEPYLNFIVPFAALSVYLTLKTYFSLIKIIIIPISIVTVSILKRVGFIKEETQMVEVTRLTL